MSSLDINSYKDSKFFDGNNLTLAYQFIEEDRITRKCFKVRCKVFTDMSRGWAVFGWGRSNADQKGFWTQNENLYVYQCYVYY